MVKARKWCPGEAICLITLSIIINMIGRIQNLKAVPKAVLLPDGSLRLAEQKWAPESILSLAFIKLATKETVSI